MIADIIEATQFLLTGSALRPLLAAPAAGMPTAQPYYPAWAAPVPTLVALRTATPTTALVVKQEQINLQRTVTISFFFSYIAHRLTRSCIALTSHHPFADALRLNLASTTLHCAWLTSLLCYLTDVPFTSCATCCTAYFPSTAQTTYHLYPS